MPWWAVLIAIAGFGLLAFTTVVMAFRAAGKPPLKPWSLLVGGLGAVLSAFLVLILSPSRPAGAAVIALLAVGLAGGASVGYTVKLRRGEFGIKSSQGTWYLVAWTGALLVLTPLLTFGPLSASFSASAILLISTVVAGYTYCVFFRYASAARKQPV
jgi:hypothetical protein